MVGTSDDDACGGEEPRGPGDGMGPLVGVLESSRWKLGSTVRINGLYNPNIITPFKKQVK